MATPTKRFDTEREAQRYAALFTYARAYHGLEPLHVAQEADGWWVMNPGNDAKMVPEQGQLELSTGWDHDPIADRQRQEVG